MDTSGDIKVESPEPEVVVVVRPLAGKTLALYQKNNTISINSAALQI